MSIDILQVLQDALFGSETRLHQLVGEGELAGLQVEAWSQREAINQPWEMHISTLSLSATLNTDAMLGQRATLQTRLADGTQAERSGIVTAASAEESDGSLARYRLTVQPWLALLAHTRRSQVFQERTLTDIIEAVFGHYSAHAAWAWAPCAAAHLAQSPFGTDGLRSYCLQYRETDLAFVTRLLAEEGLNYRFEPDATAPLGHKLVIFADSTGTQASPEDATSASALGGAGIRFHRAGSTEEQDAIQAFGGERQFTAAAVATLAWDYKAKAATAAEVPTAAAFAGSNAPQLQSYDFAGAYATQGSAGADRAAELQIQSLEARHKRFLGRSTVRTFTAGQRFTLTQSTLDLLAALNSTGADNSFLLTQVTHAGINNLPKDASEHIARALGAGGADLLEPWVDAAVRKHVADSGYANAFDASRVAVPWRPLTQDSLGAQLNPKPTGPGHITATVVGPDGQTSASGPDEIHMDALGRIRVQFPFQATGWQGEATSNSSTWVRVAQPMAGAGFGLQFIPRIGQEVLVQFLGNDIDRPLVVGSLYNGKGEAGIPATPGGGAAEADLSALACSADHSPSAQGNSAGGNSPAWHGAAPGAATQGNNGQANAAAFSGFKTKEFGGSGYNQLVFDDTNSQLRVQLATTQHATQLNLGHLVHQADNHRGSFRGLGFELRTDAYGAIRAGAGLLISSYGTQQAEPAGDNAASIALAGQLKTLGETFSKAASTHQTVALAAHIGSTKANQSTINEQAAPYKALHTTLKGMVANANVGDAQGDAANRNTNTGDDKLPHSTDAVIAIAAKAGLAQTAGQDLQLSANETITLASGQDTHIATGGAQRIHAGQAIGVLAGAIKPGPEAACKGLTMIAAQGDVEFQAQASTLQVAAKNNVTVQSANAHIDWASPKKISLSTAGGANITIEGGNITVQCPGTIMVKAGSKQFTGGSSTEYPLPLMPKFVCVSCLLAGAASGSAFAKRA